MENSKDNREINREYNKVRGQYKLALGLINNNNIELKDKKILDVGAGMGEFSNMLRKQEANLFCIDTTEKCCNNLKEMGFNTHQINLENQSLPFSDNEFDIIISLEVIEHIWNTENYLSEIKRVLKPGGQIIITTPNYNNWKYRALSLFGMFENFTYMSRHKKFYTAKSFPLELKKYFSVKKILGEGWIPKTGIEFLNKRFINLFSMQVGVLGKK